jgi:hypothetical protein
MFKELILSFILAAAAVVFEINLYSASSLQIEKSKQKTKKKRKNCE